MFFNYLIDYELEHKGDEQRVYMWGFDPTASLTHLK